MKAKLTKLSFVLLVLAMLFPGVANAQEKEGFRLVTPESVEFNPYWYMQAQIGGAYTVGETSTFKKLVSPAAALNFGYRMVPWFGLRAGFSGWQGKGYVVVPEMNYKFNYVQGNFDAIVSLTNAFCGFNPSRVLDVYLGVGIGGAYGFHNNQAENFYDAHGVFEKLWRGHRWFLAGRGILGMDINLSSVFALNIEANANMMPDSWNSKYGNNKDWQFNGLIGCTVKFGSNKRVIPAVYEEEIVEVVVAEPEPEPAPKEEPKPVVEKIQPMTQDVFFLLDSSVVRPDELDKVSELAEFMKKNPSYKVTVTGYADKETGTAPYNMTLSEKRAKAVAEALESYGIDPSRITVDADGDTVQPFDASEYTKNRVAICVTEE